MSRKYKFASPILFPAAANPTNIVSLISAYHLHAMSNVISNLDCK
jgi:hypothetical protein